MRIKLQPAILIVILLFPGTKILAQDSATTFLQEAKDNVISLFNKEIQGNSHLFNGPDYKGYLKPAISHPYYLTEEPQNGSIWYDGIQYHHVPLLYDITRDRVITFQYINDSTLSYRSFLKVDLFRERTGDFTLGKYQFIKLKENSSTKGMIPGFYELLYNGKSKVLAKRIKLYNETIKDNGIERRYDSVNRYYVFKEGQYHLVKNRKSLLAVFADKRSAVASHMRKSGLKFRKQREMIIEEAARYYDQQTN